MNCDIARQDLIAWIKARQEALPADYAPWAHGELCVLRDLRSEVDRIFGEQNARGRPCDVCQGAGGWTGLFGRWDPCPKCDPA